ncbi:hypothetical protein DB88DRAFT_471215 [Papiliotrema laurentii]|uniref:Uncharacterized protein n=1 Tax=Papiliotrema laurentii TaxID=5418 RepID=A0AAD9FV52_PAPLA|nr:hypothetical protein DB88DRAFT_471215 [Papiliotrema laurentii]
MNTTPYTMTLPYRSLFLESFCARDSVTVTFDFTPVGPAYPFGPLRHGEFIPKVEKSSFQRRLAPSTQKKLRAAFMEAGQENDAWLQEPLCWVIEPSVQKKVCREVLTRCAQARGLEVEEEEDKITIKESDHQSDCGSMQVASPASQTTRHTFQSSSPPTRNKWDKAAESGETDLADTDAEFFQWEKPAPGSNPDLADDTRGTAAGCDTLLPLEIDGPGWGLYASMGSTGGSWGSRGRWKIRSSSELRDRREEAARQSANQSAEVGE